MAYDSQVDDWEVAGIGSVGLAYGFGGGAWLFHFRSEDAGRYAAGFWFVGAGIGGGGSISGTGLPSLSDMLSNDALAGNLSWSSIDCDDVFSAKDLNWAPGRLSTAGAALTVGYSACYISAKNLPFSSLFSSQSCNGLSTGFGLYAITSVGFWILDGPADWNPVVG